MNAINGLRCLPATSRVARLVLLRELRSRCPTEVVGAVIHVALLVELDVAHLLSLITLDAAGFFDDREETVGEKMRTNPVGGQSPMERRFGLRFYSDLRATTRRVCPKG